MGLLDRFRAPPATRPKPVSGRLVAISRILDEADIVEAFVRHTAHYVSHHLFIDNGSRDGTLDILARLRAEGLGITVWNNKAVSFAEIDFNTFMYREAVTGFGADWVLCLDADEFIDDRGLDGGLPGTLGRLSETRPDLPLVNVPLREYNVSADDDASERVVAKRIRRRWEATDNTKVFISGRLPLKGLTVQGGNHFVHVGATTLEGIRIPGLFLGHFACRSAHQGLVKAVRGWAKVLAAGPDEVARGTSCHYKGLFEALRDRPETVLRDEAYFARAPNLHLTDDPIAYRGGPLSYTGPTDEPMRAVRMLMGYLDELASRYGLLVHSSDEVKVLTKVWNADVKLVCGERPS